MAQIKLVKVDRPVSQVLLEVAEGLPAEAITLRDLLERIGEQGLLIVCIVISTPFLFPIPIPLASAFLGAPILLIGIGMALNRIPWLPDWLVRRQLPSAKLASTLRRTSSYFARAERLLRPRWRGLCVGAVMNRVNGGMLALAAVVLMLPAPPLVPFSNALPACAIMTLSLGLLQRDGWCVLVSYGFLIVSIAYWCFIVLSIVWAGKGLGGLISGALPG